MSVNKTPTPETDKVSTYYGRKKLVEHARKLERERDEARVQFKNAYNYICLSHTDRERSELVTGCPICKLNQLRRVCNAMAYQYRHEMMSLFCHAKDCDCSRCEPMTKLYNSLPHVIAKKGEAV